MASENIYLVLDLFLDPPVTDFKKLKIEIQKKVNQWNRNPTNFPHQLQVANEFLELASPPGPYEGGGKLESQADEARMTREQQGKDKAASYEDDGRLESFEVAEHIKEFERFFREETIRSWFTLEIDEGGEFVFVVPKKIDYPKAKITDLGTMRRIDNDLKIILAREGATLYNLLHIVGSTDRSTIEERARIEYQDASKDPNKGRDAKTDARIRVLGEAMKIFKDDESRSGYDIAVSHRPFQQLVETRFKGRCLKQWLTVGEYQSSVKEVYEAGLERDEAEWLVYNYYCNTRGCPHPKRTDEEEVAIAKAEAEHAKEEARREIEAATTKADALIATAKKEAQDKVDAGRRDAEAEVKSARERANRLVDDAKANENDARRKQLEAENKRNEVEEIAANAVAIARKEVEDEKAASTVARLKAEEDRKLAQATTSKAKKEIEQARLSVMEAVQKKDHAENTAKLEIAKAIDAKDKQDAAEKSRWRAIVSAISIVVIAAVASLYCLQSAGNANNKAAAAIARAKELEQTFETRVATANKRAEEREVAADAKFLSADEDYKKAREKQDAADMAYAKAIEEQKVANLAAEQVQKDRVIAERDKNTALEKEKIAIETEARAVAVKKEADTTKTKAEQLMRDAEAMKIAADKKVRETTQDAARKVDVATIKAEKEAERRKGVEAMIKAGAPLRFPSDNDEQEQEKVSRQLGYSLASPLPGYGNSWSREIRSAEEILRDTVWRWCLEGELELIGEITERETKGYKESFQGSDGTESHQANIELWNHAYEDPYPTRRWSSPPLGMLVNEGQGMERLDRRFLLSQTQVTQELWESVMGNNPSRFQGLNRPVESVSWEDCQMFIAKLNEKKKALGVPTDYEFTFPLESEWEHACRAGTSTLFHFGSTLDRRRANTNGKYPFGAYEKGGGTSDVGIYPANAWGLYDMHGNVWEWCQDPYDFVGVHCVPSSEGFYRSLRGGSWNAFALYCRSAYRGSGNPLERHDDVGLRLCLAAAK